MGHKEKSNPLLPPHMPHASPGWGWWGFPMTSALLYTCETTQSPFQWKMYSERGRRYEFKVEHGHGGEF